MDESIVVEMIEKVFANGLDFLERLLGNFPRVTAKTPLRAGDLQRLPTEPLSLINRNAMSFVAFGQGFAGDEV